MVRKSSVDGGSGEPVGYACYISASSVDGDIYEGVLFPSSLSSNQKSTPLFPVNITISSVTSWFDMVVHSDDLSSFLEPDSKPIQNVLNMVHWPGLKSSSQSFHEIDRTQNKKASSEHGTISNMPEIKRKRRFQFASDRRNSGIELMPNDIDISDNERSEPEYGEPNHNKLHSPTSNVLRIGKTTNYEKNGKESLNESDLKDLLLREMNDFEPGDDIIDRHLEKSLNQLFIRHLSRKFDRSCNEIQRVAGSTVSNKVKIIESNRRRNNKFTKPSVQVLGEGNIEKPRPAKTAQKEKELTRSAKAMGAMAKINNVKINHVKTSVTVANTKKNSVDIRNKGLAFPELNESNLTRHIDDLYLSKNALTNDFTSKLASIFGVTKSDLNEWKTVIGSRLIALKKNSTVSRKESELVLPADKSPIVPITNVNGTIKGNMIRPIETATRREKALHPQDETNNMNGGKVVAIGPGLIKARKAAVIKKESVLITPALIKNSVTKNMVKGSGASDSDINPSHPELNEENLRKQVDLLYRGNKRKSNDISQELAIMFGVKKIILLQSNWQKIVVDRIIYWKNIEKSEERKSDNVVTNTIETKAPEEKKSLISPSDKEESVNNAADSNNVSSNSRVNILVAKKSMSTQQPMQNNENTNFNGRNDSGKQVALSQSEIKAPVASSTRSETEKHQARNNHDDSSNTSLLDIKRDINKLVPGQSEMQKHLHDSNQPEYTNSPVETANDQYKENDYEKDENDLFDMLVDEIEIQPKNTSTNFPTIKNESINETSPADAITDIKTSIFCGPSKRDCNMTTIQENQKSFESPLEKRNQLKLATSEILLATQPALIVQNRAVENEVKWNNPGAGESSDTKPQNSFKISSLVNCEGQHVLKMNSCTVVGDDTTNKANTSNSVHSTSENVLEQVKQNRDDKHILKMPTCDANEMVNDNSSKRKLSTDSSLVSLSKRRKSENNSLHSSTSLRLAGRKTDSEQIQLLHNTEHGNDFVRTCYRIGIAGGGLAGISCARKLLQEAKKKNIVIRVFLFEGRDRLGGRVCTEMDTFQNVGEPFPVDLGASFIHGKEGNLVHNEAINAGSKLVKNSKEIKMIGEEKTEVDESYTSEVCDWHNKLLEESVKILQNKTHLQNQEGSFKCIRWYAPPLATNKNPKARRNRFQRTDVSSKRYKESFDCTIDRALAQALREGKIVDNNALMSQGRHILGWNKKNEEFVHKASLNSISALYGMSQDKDAYTGDHVYIQEGYASIVDHIYRNCQEYSQFKTYLNYEIKKIEYARLSPQIRNPNVSKSEEKIEVSNTCRVTSVDDSKHELDFIVSALPLGILKENEMIESESKVPRGVQFEPALSQDKLDAILAVGVGCLNKVVLQFSTAFWRKQGSKKKLNGSPFLGSETYLIGNATGLHPQYYLFYDIGYLLAADKKNAPAILCVMASGKDAIFIETCKESKVISEVVEVLSYIFCEESVPKKPLRYKITRWGSDKFSRGSYSFLPPGSNPNDYSILAKPSSATSKSNNSAEIATSRLFWAGEHTNKKHPGTAHGAMESGLRAAEEVISAIEGEIFLRT